MNETIPVRKMTELENAQVRITILEAQIRRYEQEIAVLQAEKKELDMECSDLSAQNSHQAMAIDEWGQKCSLLELDLEVAERQRDDAKHAAIRAAADACKSVANNAAGQDDVTAFAWCLACESEVLKLIDLQLVVGLAGDEQGE